MSWQTARGYCWSRAMRMLGERSTASFLGVLVGSIALAIPAGVFMLAQMLWPVASRLPSAEVTAFVAGGTGAAEVKALAGRIEAIDGVARVRLISRDQAWADLQRRMRDGQAPLEMRPNPLPDALAVEFAPRAPSATVTAAVAAIAKQPRVESVLADIEWYRRLLGLIDASTNLLVPVAAIVGLLIVVVILGLVRLVAVIDRAELRLLDQIGAGGDFVRRPFIYAGATLLGLSAAGALGLLAAGQALGNPPLAELGKMFGLELRLGYPPWPLVLSFVAACLLVGGWAANVFAGKQIAMARGSS